MSVSESPSYLLNLGCADPLDLFSLPMGNGRDHTRKDDDPIFEIGDESPEGQDDPKGENGSKLSLSKLSKYGFKPRRTSAVDTDRRMICILCSRAKSFKSLKLRT